MKYLAILLLLSACDGPYASDCCSSGSHGSLTKYPDGSWFVPENSALGPPLSQVQTFITYDGTMCSTIKAQEEVKGLLCKPHVWVVWCAKNEPCKSNYEREPDNAPN